MAKIRYVGPRQTQFGTGRCPSGATYVVTPGEPVEVGANDVGYLMGQTGADGAPLFREIAEVLTVTPEIPQALADVAVANDDADTLIIRRGGGKK